MQRPLPRRGCGGKSGYDYIVSFNFIGSGGHGEVDESFRGLLLRHGKLQQYPGRAKQRGAEGNKVF